MNRETGMILRARKMAREQASRYFAPGEPGYQAKFEEIYTRLMREQLAFEDFRDKRGLSRNPTTPLCPFCGTRMKLRPSTWPDSMSSLRAVIAASLHNASRSAPL